MIDVSFKGNFLQKMNERIASWKGQKDVAARVVADKEAEWWYYQEFGTASQGEKGGAPYKITPQEADALAFQGDTGLVITGGVTHPGVKPTRMVRQVIPDVKDKLRKNVREAMKQGGTEDPTALHQAVLETAHDAKDKIAESIGRHLKTSTASLDPEFPRQGGKLQGQSPEKVFADNSHVVDLTE